MDTYLDVTRIPVGMDGHHAEHYGTFDSLEDLALHTGPDPIGHDYWCVTRDADGEELSACWLEAVDFTKAYNAAQAAKGLSR